MTEAKAASSNHSFQENSESIPHSYQEEQFRLVLDASPDGFILLRNVYDQAGAIADFTIEYINPVAAKGVNQTPEALQGQYLLQLLPECKTNGSFDRYVAVAKTGISETFETFYETKELSGWFRHVVVRSNDGIAVSFNDISERKQAEAEHQQAKLALQQQAQHFKIALQTAKLGSWEHDLTTGVLTCSAQCKANFGLPSDAEFTHETLFAALHPDDRPVVEAAIQRSIRERVDYEVEERCYHPDGSLHWLIVRGQILYDVQGTPVRMVGVTFDITEQKRIEEALRESQELFHSFMNHSPLAAFIKDATGRYLYANPWVERVYQRAQADIIGKTDFELLSLEIAKQVHANDVAVLTSGQPMQMLETIHHEDGDHTYISFKFPLQHGAETSMLAGVAIDVSERIEAETALRQREAELSLITNAVPVLISFVDTEQRYRFNNQKYEEWFGKPAVDMNGKYLWEVLGQTAYEAIRPYVEQVLTGREVTFETRINYQKGTFRDAVVNYVPQFDPQGQVEGFVALVSDITHRKQAEETLKQSEERLRIAQKAANAGVWDWNITTNQVSWSNEYYRLYGLDPATTQPSYENWLCSIHELDRDRVDWVTRQALEHQIDLNVEFRILHPTQGERWLIAIGQTFYDNHQQPQRMTGIALDITERKQTEAALRQSEERLRLAMAGAQMGTWDVDLVTGKAVWSDQHFIMLGYDPVTDGEATEDMWINCLHPDDIARVIDEWQQSRKEKRFYRAEYRVIRADNGKTSWLAAFGSFSYDSNGHAVRSIGVLFDITDRKQAEDALRNSAERLSLALTAAKMGDWSWDAATDVVTFSEQAAELFGIPPGPCMTWTQIQTLLHPDDQERARLQVQQSIADHSDYDIEYRVIRSPQTEHSSYVERWIAAKGRAQYDASGRVLGMLGVVQDITYRKQAEVEREQLLAREQSANETLQRFIERTPVAVVMLDHNMRYLFASDRWMQEYASGYSDLKGLSLYEVMVDIPESWYEVYQRCLAGATERCEAERFVRADGSVLWLHWEVLPWYASEGKIGGIIIFSENITERKQATHEREILLKREQAAREEAERANRIKDEFLAVLSHELRSPLNPILGWAKLLQSRSFDESATQRALQTIERNAKLQTQLIDDLLDVSRILRGKMVLSVGLVNLSAIIDAALETVQLSAEAKDIAIQKVVIGDVDSISGDAGRLQQIVWNLLSNAVKFTPTGGQITIRLEQIDSRQLDDRKRKQAQENQFAQHPIPSHHFMHSYAQITVSDTGKGIAPEFLPHVFEYFRQEDGTTTRKFGGLGLGLAIVRYLAEQHGGTVQADSAGEGQGSTFIVRLPLKYPKLESECLAQDNNSSLTCSAQPLLGLKILVTDDEPDIRELILAILTQAGATVTVTASAMDALRVLDTAQPDLLISDIGMPDIDGYELLRRIRERSPISDRPLPAIALTAYAGAIDKRQALAAGFQHHIAKPVEPDTLVKAIAALFKSEPSAP